MSESIGPMCHHIFLPLGRLRFPVGPVPGYRTRRKEHALSIVRDEFRPAIPRSGSLRANIDETPTAAIITEQGGKEKHRERSQDCSSFCSQFGGRRSASQGATDRK